MKINCVTPININLSNGVYLLQKEGGVGKSYLAYLLAKAYGNKIDTAVVTYKNNTRVVYGDLKKAKVIMLDRVDRYVDTLSASAVEGMGKNAIVLMDCKCYYSSFNVSRKRAYLSYDGDKIEVTR